MCRQTLRNEVPEAGKPALSCGLNRSDVLRCLTHCQLSPLLQTRPSDPQLMCRHDNSESRCAVQSSALIDGTVALQRRSPGSAAAHVSIGVTEHYHRQSHAIAAHHSMRARRQDNVRSVVLDLHQVSPAVAELHVQRVAVIASLTLRTGRRRHAYLPSSLLSLTAACARTSAAAAAGSPQ
jgi:hypothetical protein